MTTRDNHEAVKSTTQVSLANDTSGEPTTKAELTLASSALMKDTNESLGFTSLSGELRNRIYRMALTSNNAILVYARFNNGPGPHSFTQAQPALAATCRLLRKEALSIYYAENTFYLSDNMFRRGAAAAWIRLR